jgi:hypothetical protein
MFPSSIIGLTLLFLDLLLILATLACSILSLYMTDKAGFVGGFYFKNQD